MNLPKLLFTRSFGQTLSLVFVLLTSTLLSLVAAIGAYFYLFDLPVTNWDQPIDLSPTHMMITAFVVFPIALAGGILGGFILWHQIFRMLRPDAPPPDQLTEKEVEQWHRRLSTPLNREFLHLKWIGLIIAVAALIFVLKR